MLQEVLFKSVVRIFLELSIKDTYRHDRKLYVVFIYVTGMDINISTLWEKDRLMHVMSKNSSL